MEYGATAPYVLLRGGGDATLKRQFYVKWVVICVAATAVVAGVAWKGGAEGGEGRAAIGGNFLSVQLGGAYYAVSKPPAFNFNRGFP